MTNTSRIEDTENEIVQNFLREQHDQLLSGNGGSGAHDISESKFHATGTRTLTGDDETTLTEDIRKIARALAPQISELEDVLKDFTDTETADALEQLSHSNSNFNDISRSMMEDEDDDLDDELNQLATSEQALREELEFAAGISMLGSPSPIRGDIDGTHSSDDAVPLPSPVDLNPRLEQVQHSEVDNTKEVIPSAYTLQDHANYLQLKTERTGSWYYIQMTSKLLPTALSGCSSDSIAETEDLVKDYCLPIPFRKLKRIYSGLVFYDVWESKRRQATPRTPSHTPVFNRLLQTPAKSRNASLATTPTPATPAGFTMAVPATPATPATTKRTASDSTPLVTKDNLNTPRTPLQSIKNTNIDNNSNMEEPLPIRTIAIRVRPDVLCGAVMDAANHAFEILPSDCTTHIIKRQGAHLRGAVYLPKQQLAYVADIQLCTQKNDALERRLLLRFYHIQDDPDALNELGQILHRKHQQQKSEAHTKPAPNENKSGIGATTYSSTIVNDDNCNDVMAEERSIANRHMKQTCSLIQRLMAAEKQKGGIKNMDHNQQSR